MPIIMLMRLQDLCKSCRVPVILFYSILAQSGKILCKSYILFYCIVLYCKWTNRFSNVECKVINSCDQQISSVMQTMQMSCECECQRYRWCTYITIFMWYSDECFFFHFITNSPHKNNKEKQHGKQISMEKDNKARRVLTAAVFDRFIERQQRKLALWHRPLWLSRWFCWSDLRVISICTNSHDIYSPRKVLYMARRLRARHKRVLVC